MRAKERRGKDGESEGEIKKAGKHGRRKISHVAGYRINPDDLSVFMFSIWKSQDKHIKQSLTRCSG